jgi:prepilin-type N-terminal cleavage/methylation domain-containing protein
MYFFNNIKNNTKKARPANAKGFTFVEIIVVLGIFAILSSVVLFNFKDFSSGIDLQNMSQQIALQVSSMQRKALSGQSSGPLNVLGLGGSRWKPAYGLCFTDGLGCGLATGSDGKAFVLFADNGNDNEYSDMTSNSSETIDTIIIPGNDIVSNVCVYEGTECNSKPWIQVIYTRPNVKPEFLAPSSNSGNIEGAKVTVSSPSGGERDVIIWKSGQVEVN